MVVVKAQGKLRKWAFTFYTQIESLSLLLLKLLNLAKLKKPSFPKHSQEGNYIHKRLLEHSILKNIIMVVTPVKKNLISL